MAPIFRYIFFFIFLVLVFCTISSSTCHDQRPNPSPNPIPNPKNQCKAIFTFGDSLLDSGNNNFILTLIKADHPPYGQSFPGRIATGRFSDGKLISDFIASGLGIKDTIPPFLEPNLLLSKQEFGSGVSFASAGSGFDELTSAITKTIPVAKQTEHFKTYVDKLRAAFGDAAATNIISQSLMFIAAGSEDFYVNYYGTPTRQFHLGLNGYQDFLHRKIQEVIKTLYDMGCRNFLIAGLPPLGCKPLQITEKLRLDRKCVEDENRDAESYNRKLMWFLPRVQAILPGSKIVYADIYTPIIDMVNNPQKYGFVVTNSGCCGTGLVEAGVFCKAFSPVCPNPSQFLYWDSFNPTESANRHIAEFLKNSAISRFLYSTSFRSTRE